MEIDQSVRDAAVAHCSKLSKHMFALRGNHTEMHLDQEALAAHLVVAYEHGVRACLRVITGESWNELEDKAQPERR